MAGFPIPSGITATLPAGDLGGTSSTPTVVGIQGVAISGTPVAGQALYFNGTNWIPVPLVGEIFMTSQLCF